MAMESGSTVISHESIYRFIYGQIARKKDYSWRHYLPEFALHYQLHDLGIETFFCDTYSPWQKGGVENAIGRLRRTLPRKTDLAALPQKRFTQMIQAYNNTPRKCLDYRTPAEIFLDRVLHLKCESTCPPARA